MNETQKQVINSRLNEILMIGDKSEEKEQLITLIHYFYMIGKQEGKEELFNYMKTLL